jgi:hypothetical protein
MNRAFRALIWVNYNQTYLLDLSQLEVGSQIHVPGALHSKKRPMVLTGWGSERAPQAVYLIIVVKRTIFSPTGNQVLMPQ